MLLKRFYDESLAQASYLLGCQATGEALVVDANRDVEQYVAAAQAEGLRVTHVTETHIHADFVSGSRELERRTGASLLLPGEGGPRWSYAFAKADRAVLLRDGDGFDVGRVRVDVMHTPGHTPEHITLLVTDTPAGVGVPVGAFTGDFIFVGDVGRPDLLERAAKMEGTMVEGARALFASLGRFRALPDHVQLWPGHGAGSACGKALGAMPQTTLGYEKLANWGFRATDEDEFVRAVLEGQPEPPRYFAQMKRINRDGPPLLGGLTPPPALPATRLQAALDAASAASAVVLDARPAADFAAGHVPGTLGIPLNKSFATWAGWLVPYDRDIYLIADTEGARAAARALALIGLDRVCGSFEAAALDAWRRDSGRALQPVAQITPRELASRLSAGAPLAMLDVRGRGEWEEGHIPGTPNVPLGYLAERLAEVPRDRPVVLHCQGGGRSMIAAGLLQSLGVPEVINLAGGFTDWRRDVGLVER
jgi:hydroxyacylglutathione hydrolase